MKLVNLPPAVLKPQTGLWRRRVGLPLRSNKKPQLIRRSESSATEISRPNSSQDHNGDISEDITKEQNYSRPLSAIASKPATPDVPLPTQHKKHPSVEVTAQPSPLIKKKSMKQRFSLFSRKSMVVAAH